jgi:hypothetical protein
MFDSSPLKENLANIIFIISVALQSCDSFLKNYLCFKNKLVFFFCSSPPPPNNGKFLSRINKQTNKNPGEDSAEAGKSRMERKVFG